MRLLIIVPRQPSCTGNQVTAKRLAASLPAHGWYCTIVETDSDSPAAVSQALAEKHPDAALLLHAYRSGKPWLLSEPAVEIPVAVLMTGTDYNYDYFSPDRGPIIEKLLRRSSLILIQNQLILPRFTKDFPYLADKLQHLPPGIRIGAEKYLLRKKLNLRDNTPLFLLPAGIRPVKGNLDLLLMCDRIVRERLNFNIAFCGPTLDDEYAARFLNALDERPWAHYLGEIPKMAMGNVMREADVVLNNSRSEGVSNSLVEAVSLGRPILASDIVGNRAIVQHGKNGLLYFGQDQFFKQALQLINDPKLRLRLSKPNPSIFTAERESQLLATALDRISGINTTQARRIGADG